MNERVYCLYRVSTDRQVDYDINHNADIPMQRKVCRKFAAEKGWTIVHEEQEEGVSGHKVRAEKRDKLQIIKQAAMEGKFDIFLVFMFDRIGRIADETPFVVEWFVRNGIRVWSAQEGEQRIDTHTDKLLNYIRFWQADGESEKTSIRTRTRMGQLVEEGFFKGGNAPYGYQLVKSGHINKRKHELLELEIVEEEAAVVRIIFEKYAYEGYGAQRIATYLNDKGYRARSGKPWHHASIRGMICNLTYTGILRCGESRSELQPHLQIISQELYDTAQQVRESRGNNSPGVPRNTRGKSLLVGNIYCAHCGARLCVTTNTKKNAAGKEVVRIRYICYGKTRRQTNCDGQTGYKMETIDNAVDQLVQDVFDQVQGVSKGELLESRYQISLSEQRALVQAARSNYARAEDELATLKKEVVKAIKGESAFSSTMLSELISESEAECTLLRKKLEEAQSTYEQSNETVHQLEQKYDELVSMSEMYSQATFEAKKMIVARIIDRVDVSRGYQLNVVFKSEFMQFLYFLVKIKL